MDTLNSVATVWWIVQVLFCFHSSYVQEFCHSAWIIYQTVIEGNWVSQADLSGKFYV